MPMSPHVFVLYRIFKPFYFLVHLWWSWTRYEVLVQNHRVIWHSTLAKNEWTFRRRLNRILHYEVWEDVHVLINLLKLIILVRSVIHLLQVSRVHKRFLLLLINFELIVQLLRLIKDLLHRLVHRWTIDHCRFCFHFLLGGSLVIHWITFWIRCLIFLFVQ